MNQAIQATPVAIEVLIQDRLGWLAVSCPDYDAFSGLPLVVTYEGEFYTRRGWNSDVGRAYYEPGTRAVAWANQ